MGSPVRIAVLKWSDILAEYALFMLMTYLTDVWKLNFRKAAAIVNVFWGMIAILPIGLKFIKLKKNIPDRWMVLLCSLAYTVGLGLISFSSPKLVSGKIDYSDASYSSVGVRRETLFYMSLPLIVIARSGFAISLEKLITDEKGGISDTVIHFSLSIGAMVLVNIVGIAISYIIKQWLTRFGIPALCMAVATLIFSTGFCSYGRGTTAEPGLLTKVSNDVHKLLTYLLELSKKCILCPLRCFCCCFVKYFDKSHQPPEPEQKNETMIEETKFIISLIPICLLGLVSSLGNTYFLEQAYSMDRKIIGPLKVPLVILLALYNLAKFLFPKFYFDTLDSWLPSGCTRLKRFLNRIGMALSLLCALLCCVLAAKVESRRIDIVKKQGGQMNLLYLVPQFFLLGGFYGMAYESVERFFKDSKIPDRMKPYMVDSAVGVFGLGNIGSVLLVYLVKQITSKGEGSSWFRETINTSRLDKYYWLLSVWTAANLVWYVFVAVLYPPKKKSSTQELDEEAGFSLTSLAKKYCCFLKCLPEKVPDCCCCCCCFICCSKSSDPKQEAYTANRQATYQL